MITYCMQYVNAVASAQDIRQSSRHTLQFFCRPFAGLLAQVCLHLASADFAPLYDPEIKTI